MNKKNLLIIGLVVVLIVGTYVYSNQNTSELSPPGIDDPNWNSCQAMLDEGYSCEIVDPSSPECRNYEIPSQEFVEGCIENHFNSMREYAYQLMNERGDEDSSYCDCTDINNDGNVDKSDINEVIRNWWGAPLTYICGDLGGTDNVAVGFLLRMLVCWT